MIFLICCGILFAGILLSILHLCSSVILAYSLFCCCCCCCCFLASLFGFGIRVMVASYNEFGSLPSSSIFWKSLSRIGVSSSLNFFVEFICEAVWSWDFVCWEISDYRFDFCACDGFVKIFYFFLVQFWKVILF